MHVRTLLRWSVPALSLFVATVTQAAVETGPTIEKKYGGGKFASLAEIRPEAMCRDCLIPLHPGAEAYYRESGYLK